MAVDTLVSVEEYLTTNFEHDADYVDGEVIERGMPTRAHGLRQGQAVMFFGKLSTPERRLFVIPELRMKLGESRYRVSDLAVYVGEDPVEEYPTVPPLIALEVLSPDDRPKRVAEKLAEYERWGVTHIWLVDPLAKKLFIFRNGAREQVESFLIPELDAELKPEDLF